MGDEGRMSRSRNRVQAGIGNAFRHGVCRGEWRQGVVLAMNEGDRQP